MMMAQGVTYKGIPLMITNVGDELIEVSLNFNATRRTTPPIVYYNTTGKKSYKKWDLSNITLAKGGTLYLFGENSVVDSTFVINGNSSIHVDGKLEALLQGQVGTAQFGNYALEGLFKNVTQLESVGDIMPQIIGGVNAPSGYSNGYRYSSLFENTGIVEIPNNFLKETALGDPHLGIYHRMFFGCTKLTTIPRDLFINQSSSSNFSYQSMFQNCSNLEVAADVYCQSQAFMTAYSMYRGCKKITDVKVFTKTLSSNHCMQYFVADCDNLQSIDYDINRVTHWGVLANAMLNCKNLTKVSIKVKTWNHEQTITQNGAYSDWMQGVSPTGTFICTKELGQALEGYYQPDGTWVEPTVSRGVSTVPAGWYIDYPIIDARDGDANAMALMAVISQQTHADETPWVKDSLVMMKSEAEKVEDIGDAFASYKTTTFTFNQLVHFTALTSIGGAESTGFQYSYLTSVTLPNTLQVVGSYAFNQTRISSIVIPFGVTSIGNDAFYGCRSLTSITIPNSVTSIGDNAFYSTILSSITIPNSVTSIGSSCFRFCRHLTSDSITVGTGLTTISNGLFRDCTSLTNIDFIPLNVTEIEPNAFQSTGLTSATIHKNISSIVRCIFNGCNNLSEIIVDSENNTYDSRDNCNAIIHTSSNSIVQGCKTTVIPSSIKGLNHSCFAGMTSITSLTIPEGVISLGNGCLRETRIVEMVVPDSVTNIDSNAFNNNPAMTRLDIGTGVKIFGGTIVNGNSNLSLVTIRAVNPPSIQANTFQGYSGNIYVPNDSVVAYKAAAGWSTMADRIKPLSDLPQE